ncbi:MAG: hypothetical protein RLZZ245_46 [Verrucomicrobiota bacterium]|jgi:hypothetical protein
MSWIVPKVKSDREAIKLPVLMGYACDGGSNADREELDEIVFFEFHGFGRLVNMLCGVWMG